MNLFNNSDFEILYPNGGTQENPAEIKVGQRYVFDNPFKGHEVICRAEVLYEGKWGEANWVYDAGQSAGARASHLLPEDKIVLMVGITTILGHSFRQANAFETTFVNGILALPCRIKVFKVAKVSNVDYTMLYPNNGTAEKPGEIAVNKRYVMDNPFKDFEVICKTEVLFEGVWAEADWCYDAAQSIGARSFQISATNEIVLMTGVTSIVGHSFRQPNPFNTTKINGILSLPCRVKVFKLAKM